MQDIEQRGVLKEVGHNFEGCVKKKKIHKKNPDTDYFVNNEYLGTLMGEDGSRGKSKYEELTGL